MQAELSMPSPPTTNGHAALNGHKSGNAEQLHQLQSVSTTVLRQALDLVENTLTQDDQLLVHSRYLPGSTIGMCALHRQISCVERHGQENIFGMRVIISWP